MSLALESPGLYQAEKMSNESSPDEKTEPDPLLDSQENQVKQNGTTQVTIAPEGVKSSKAGGAGWLSQLKAGARRWAVPSVVLNLLLLIIIIILIILIALPAKQCEPCPATPACPVSACPDGWIGYLGKCYYFSEAEANWTSSQSNCSALGASLVAVDTPEEMGFMRRYGGPNRYWISFHRDPGQPWKWTSGTEFNDWFKVAGEETCAFMNDNVISSSSCSRNDTGSAANEWRKQKAKQNDHSLGEGA